MSRNISRGKVCFNMHNSNYTGMVKVIKENFTHWLLFLLLQPLSSRNANFLEDVRTRLDEVKTVFLSD